MELLNIFLRTLSNMTLQKETARHLTLSISLFKTKFKPVAFRLATVTKQLSIVGNIFKATALTYFSFSERIEKVI